MTAIRCLSSFSSRFLQRIVQEFLALFRFTEKDACIILSAYGLHPFEIHRLQSNHPEPAESASKKKVARAQPTEPIPIGIHPDFHLGKLEIVPKQIGAISQAAVSLFIQIDHFSTYKKYINP